MENTAKRILFVEDDPIVLTMYRKRLERDGFQVESAEDGATAIQLLPQVMPDLVVLDLMLPRCNGLEVLKSIRSDENLRATPVMVLSNVYLAEMAQKTMQAGANKGLLKTECTPRRLLEAVQDLLGCPPLPVNKDPFASTHVPGTKKFALPETNGAKAFLAAAAAAHAEEVSLKTAREKFLELAPASVAKIRERCRAYLETVGSPAGLQNLNELYQQVHFFSVRAGLHNCTKLCLLSTVFEALLFEIVHKPTHVPPSAQRTITQAADCLGRLLQEGETGPAVMSLKAKVLVVDDDPICNHMTVSALRRAHLDPVSVEDPEVALQLLQNNHIDLIMLDISMPTMSGFELCEKLRELPQYKTTPVIFVTVNGDFQSRAQSVLSGGNDLITKPTSPLELALKTTLHLLVPQRLLESVAAQSTNIQPQKLKLADEAQEKESRTQAFAASNPSLTEPEQSVTEPTSDKPTCEPVLTPAESPDLEDQMNNPLFTAVESGPDEFPDDLKQLLSEIEASETASHAQKADSNVAAETESESAALPGPESTEPPAQFAPADQSETTASDANGQTNETIPETPAEIETCGGEPVFTHVTEEQRSIEITCEEPAQNHEEITVIMQNQQNEPLEKVARGAANIMFGDHQATELNVRLTRIALERYGVQANSPLDKTAQSVAQIMFGDDAVTQLHVRLTQIALECYSNRGTTNNYVGNTESTGTTEPHAVPEPVAAHA